MALRGIDIQQMVHDREPNRQLRNMVSCQSQNCTCDTQYVLVAVNHYLLNMLH
ncbi:hypothetical protein OIDMADRAFT_21347, partial [Oidiodendron maius Zn]